MEIGNMDAYVVLFGIIAISISFMIQPDKNLYFVEDIAIGKNIILFAGTILIVLGTIVPPMAKENTT